MKTVASTAPAASPEPVSAGPVPPQPAPRPPRPFWQVVDRTFALFLGIGVGVVIGGALFGQASPPPKRTAPPPSKPAASPVELDSAIPFPPHLLSAVATGQPITVGVFGDSFGDGVWAALYQLLPKSDYRVLRFSKEATGFTRYASLNLEDRLSQQIAGQTIDIAVVEYGANDTQGIYDGSKAYALLSDGWKRTYGARMDRFVGLLRNNGAMVYWVGLPKMRKPDYDQQIADMEAFYSARMTALGVPYIDVEPLSVDVAGQFNDYLPDPESNQPRLMRANDGIHMTFSGYARLAAPVVQRIETYVTRAKAVAAIDAPLGRSTSADAGSGSQGGKDGGAS